MVARVVDLAERLAERCLATHDWQAAAWAARQGLRALPCDERLYRALMRSARGSGDTDLVHQRFEDLCDAIADPDTGVEPDDTLHPETVELLETLVARRPRHLEGTSDQAPDDATGEAGDDHLAA
jgi:DNA-binding SARP family transcriptional activator